MFRVFLFSAVWIGLAGPAWAEQLECAQAAVNAVQERYDGVSDIRARFEQTSESALDGSRRESRGNVVLAKPGRMRWSYEAPAPSLVVSDGETLWLFDPSFGEAQKLPAGEGFLSGAAARFLLGEGEIARDFEVTALDCDERAARLELVPRAPASYEKVQLQVDSSTGDIHSTRILDLLGNVSTVTFLDLRSNTHPPASTFRFEPPEGTKVIEISP